MAKTQSPFTDEEKKALQSAALQVWDEVAYDCLQGLAEEGKHSMPRSHVIEVSLDAGRPEQILRKDLARAEKNGKTEEAAILKGLIDKLSAPYTARAYTYEQLIAAVKPAFPYRTYGM